MAGTRPVNEAMATRQRHDPGQHGDDDERLIAAVRRKDIDAFEELYRTYYTRLTRFLLRLVNRPKIGPSIRILLGEFEITLQPID